MAISGRMRLATFAVFGLLWTSGCIWLIVHYLLAPETELGPGPHPLEPALLKVHGWLAVGGVFVLGWVSGEHIIERWSGWRSRVSGLTLSVLASVLLVSGYGLYYFTERIHDLSAAIHEVLGVAAIGVAVTHWWGNGRRR